MTSTERQKLLLQQEIAKLSGRLSQHASSSAGPSASAYQARPHSTYHPYQSRGTTYRGFNSSRGRGSGRGRGGHVSTNLDLRSVNRANAAAVAKSTPASASTSTPEIAGETSNIASGSTTQATISIKGKEKEDGEVSRTPSPVKVALRATLPASAKKPLDNGPGWVKSSRGNSLMTTDKQKQLKSQPQIRKLRPPPQIQMLASTSTPNGSQQVVIDGVIFKFEPGGTQLTRIGEVTAAQSSTLNSTPTRRKLEWGGRNFRRNNTGDLVSSRRKPRQSTKDPNREFCLFFTKMGRCERANTCPYKHDSSRLAICPLFLRGRGICSNPPGTCTLSHTPSAHNTPSCVNFQSTSTCRFPTCLYPHVRVSPTAAVCEAFAREGWCDAPAGTCPKLHVWECQEWREKGTCSRGIKCGLQHVLRAASGSGVGQAEKEGLAREQVMSEIEVDTRGGIPEEGQGFDDGASWIGVPSLAGDWEMDHGVPAPAEISEEGESEDVDGSDDDSSVEDDEDEEENQPTTEILSTSQDPISEDVMETDDDSETDTEDEEEEVLGVVL